jgi:hypothetical protein
MLLFDEGELFSKFLNPCIVIVHCELANKL